MNNHASKSASLALIILILLSTGCASRSEISSNSTVNQELVVLAHGLGRSDWAMWLFANRVEAAGYEVCTIDYDSIGESVESVLNSSATQIQSCIANSHKVHFIGHSLGGLLIRALLQYNQGLHKTDRLGQVVLIGTPNKGSELADHYQGSWLMAIAGSMTQALVTGNTTLGKQIKEIPMNLGVIAGTRSSIFTNDVFNGPNDGLVSVESTQLPSMSDFITVDSGHAFLRYDQEVARQSIHFLQFGTFEHRLDD